ncbi:MAG: peptide-methionine (S)-S-oxide reductase MsrA [Proteobacteria bacterium]|nr:peptide-methionine (S)-S-oxide reductase MsrA [Pseudomonadota bacterium]
MLPKIAPSIATSIATSIAASVAASIRAVPGRAAVIAGAGLLVLAAASGHLPGLRAHAAALDKPLPPPAVDERASGASRETMVVAGGCFWGVQGVFQHVRGVAEATAGYDGGKASTAQYETVSTGTTGHAESVRVTFDPRLISYGQLLRIFFTVATDPTQVNAQYPDTGTQYRSEIFTNSPAQARVAKAYIAQLDHAAVFRAPIATIVGPNTGFYPAEDYHQNYLTLHPDSGYIATFDLPKITALGRAFPAEYSAAPVLVPEGGKS